MMSSRRILLSVVFLLFISCAKSETQVAESSGAASDVAVSRVQEKSAPQSPADATSASTAVKAVSMPVNGPMIVRTVEMAITVADVSRAFSSISALASGNGGYVAGSRVWSADARSYASVIVRVPAARLDAFMSATRGLAKGVQTETMHGEDVTREFVDLGSRLRNLEATENELLALLTSIRANSRKAAEVLEIHREITNIRGQIEEAKGRIQYLQQMAAFSTVTIEIGQDAVAKKVDTNWGLAGVARDAIRALVATVRVVATALIWVVIYVLPIALLFAVCVWLLRAILRSLRSRAVIQ